MRLRQFDAEMSQVLSIRNVASRYQWQPGGPHIDRGGGGSTA
jgi:hypothetical protein